MSEKVNITRVETMPELDPYHRDTCGESYTSIRIDPEARTVSARQEYHTNSTYMDEWLRQVLAITPAQRPDEDDLRAYLEGDEGQAILNRICDGHTIEWDGSNQRGYLTEDAEAAFDELGEAIDTVVMESAWALWSPDDWFDHPTFDEVFPNAKYEPDFAALAKEYIADARADHVILAGDVEEYLRYWWRGEHEEHEEEDA